MHSLFLVALLGNGLVASASAIPPCNLSKQADDMCEDFCNYRCGLYNSSAGDTGRRQNLTLYRLTPTNVTGLQNKNTGDAPGDIGYWLTTKNLTRMCARDPEAHGCIADGSNIYGRFVVEMDGLFGPYMECNPRQHGGTDPVYKPEWKDSRDFVCGQGCLFPTMTGCHDFSPYPAYNATSGAFGAQCHCHSNRRDAITVGRAQPAFLNRESYGVPTAWGPQCQSGYKKPPSGFCVQGEVYKVVHGWSFESTLALACDLCRKDSFCSGWSTRDNTTAELFRGSVTSTRGDCISAAAGMDPWYKQQSWYGVGDLGGLWYSTPLEGQCAPGQKIGTHGCTWREVASSYKNASCVNGKVDASVESFGVRCFNQCPQPLNRTSDCYLDCYRDVLMGNAGTNVSKIPSLEIIRPWVLAFEENDPARGGCPEVMPAPCSGAQCDPLLSLLESSSSVSLVV
eukprot:TRINITY_DN2058_c0_g1_i1.p1 TRINITY_DN2058_c0_g1~~TRINITY_DN2058_c0_g1_i1.p1  ORF type:complete len:469 (-),score=29.05 TRINITY_DN2058_c0_g1_i1:279-1637(-)